MGASNLFYRRDPFPPRRTDVVPMARKKNEEKESFKKVVLKYLWRVQQAQMVISMVFWSMTLTGIFYPYFRIRFDNWGFGQQNVFFGMLLMFLLVLVGIIVFGIIWDRLKFWKEHQMVIVERNPYTAWKLNPIQISWAELWVETAKSLPNRTPELDKKIEFFEDWIARCQEVDPWAREMRELTYKFAMEGDDTVLRTLSKAEE